jgi:hypothetical protein
MINHDGPDLSRFQRNGHDQEYSFLLISPLRASNRYEMFKSRLLRIPGFSPYEERLFVKKLKIVSILMTLLAAALYPIRNPLHALHDIFVLGGVAKADVLTVAGYAMTRTGCCAFKSRNVKC